MTFVQSAQPGILLWMQSLMQCLLYRQWVEGFAASLVTWTTVSTTPSNAVGSSLTASDHSLHPLIELPFDEINDSFTTDDGVIIQTYDWGGEGPPLLLAHATGLHAHVWLPLVQRLRSSFHCYAIDARAQGDSTAPEGAQRLVDENTAFQIAGAILRTKLPIAPRAP